MDGRIEMRFGVCTNSRGALNHALGGHQIRHRKRALSRGGEIILGHGGGR